MAEYSYPVVEKPMTPDQWRSATLGIGSGVLDEGGGPYTISTNNVDNTVTIRVDFRRGYSHAILSGFYHRIDSPMTVPVPAVSARTTYTIALCYDPLSLTTPVSLKVVTGPLEKTGGKEWLVLHRITREPNQLLSDATVQTVKPSIAPLINVRNFEDLPDPADVMVSTTAFVSAEEATYRVSGVSGAARWHKISGTYFESAATLNGWTYRTTFPKEIAVTPAKGALHCQFSGQIIHQNADTTIAGTQWVPLGSLIPPSLCSPNAADLHLPGVYFHGSTGITNMTLALNLQNGFLSALPPSGGMLIKRGGAITINATWSTPRATLSW